MALPILNVDFKTENPKRTIYSAEKVIEWYKTMEAPTTSNRQLIRSFLQDILPDPQYRAKIVVRQPNYLLIETYRWLETTNQAMSHHLWLISKEAFDYIKLI